MARVIATGDYRRETEMAVNWLKEHGSTVEDCNGISMITLAPNLDMGKGGHSWQYLISDDNSDTNEHVEVQLDVDVNETMLFFHPAEQEESEE